ncbi:ketoacyl-ACP synthase III family protein [Kitasatospora sp. NPDC005856]|uniref:ketoacyl-ACP synthase III family protein n=1 Tax=Kitasatospora sp. NPDC005856 TaxID=3154566 RepID=UPI0033DB1285
MRLAEPVSITAAALWLPEERDRVECAVQEGRLTPRHARDLGHEDVPAAVEETAPDMAVAAARKAMDAVGVQPKELDLTFHASMYYQGHDLWSPAHYIAHRIGADRALPIGIQQVCNGGSTAIQLASTYLTAGGGGVTPRRALVTTADRFTAPGFDRWASDYGVAYGDGGTAVVLSGPGAETDDGLLLRSTASTAAAELEAMHRGVDPFAPVSRGVRDRVDMRITKRAYLREHGNERFVEVNRRSIRTIIADALDGAGMHPGDPRLRYAVLPRFGRKTLQDSWLTILAEETTAEPLDFGRSTGHLGAGDAVAGLADLLEADVLAPGEAALVFSAGAGFTWSCLLVQAPER